jgi:hypothetical protein
MLTSIIGDGNGAIDHPCDYDRAQRFRRPTASGLSVGISRTDGD